MADKSLDEIIQEKKIGGSRGRGRGRGTFRGGRGSNAWQSGRGRGGGRVQKPVGGGNFRASMPNRAQVVQSLTRQKVFRPSQAIAVTVPDARDKLIHKARLTDAREKLNKKAQLVDVRVKLNARRQKGQQQQQQPQQQLTGTDGTPGSQLLNPGKRKLTEITINNPSAAKQRQMTGPTQFTISNPQTKTPKAKVGADSGGVSISTDGLQVTTVNKSAQKRQAKQQTLQLQRTVPVEDSLEDDLIFQPVSAKFKKIAAQAPPLRVPQPNIKTTIQNVQQTAALQRVASQDPLSVAASTQGTRLIVSNLHSSVSEADIKELYGDVGPLKKARLVRSGLAEVVYIKREHALEAIARYHNRELDGLPMQCKLDTSTVPEAAGGIHIPVSGKRISMNERFKLIGAGASGTTDFSPSTVGMRSDAMSPNSDPIDATTIHKALFKTGASSAASSRPVVFTVKI
ncbi:polymerase delta-interacting protein 3-like isoform X2 [Acanthaster planci]|uniref:Polymerase delta-interacting protein 3-like isoform X2 n=1 Tax=Acanthaster planci TaxID=133434 RepID=A0A8B7Y805_ACAPL|nr:polymerase delta-interacting protein 3-like isoform X2 [Acanthaster planci]